MAILIKKGNNLAVKIKKLGQMTEQIENEYKLGFKSENKNLHYCVSCNANFNTNCPIFYLNRKKLVNKKARQ